jgi:hypothetical protein
VQQQQRIPGELPHHLNYPYDPLPHGHLRLERIFQTREYGGCESIVLPCLVEDILDTLDEALVVVGGCAESREDVLTRDCVDCGFYFYLFSLWREMGKFYFYMAA